MLLHISIVSIEESLILARFVARLLFILNTHLPAISFFMAGRGTLPYYLTEEGEELERTTILLIAKVHSVYSLLFFPILAARIS